ncbi:MAG: cyclic nucleotide-binding domain-containing protein [Planctomycetaceae bacterium]|nr:cyclic nucleotide-binding domain-containing protein [Planctomycetaceae bacterium]MCB9953552.1 cyclic nucleotide-binding domain-containing protein [Planctomycetaceae bacterium]
MFELTPQLKNCVILKGLSDRDLELLLDHATFEDFDQGVEILTEGLQYQSLWVLMRGEACVIKYCDGHQNELARLGPGSVFGEMSFFEDTTHSATVTAVTPCHTVRLKREDYEKLRVDAPDTAYKISLNVVHVLSERLRRMDSWTCRLVERECGESNQREWNDFRAKLYLGTDF